MTMYAQNNSKQSNSSKESFAAEMVGSSDASQMNKAQTSSPTTPNQGVVSSSSSADSNGVTSSKDIPANIDKSVPNEVTVPGLEPINYHPIGATADQQTSENQSVDESPHRALDCDFACQGLAAELTSSAILQSIAPTIAESDGQEGASAVADGLNAGALFLDAFNNLADGYHRRSGERQNRRRARRRARRESGVLTFTGPGGIQEVVNDGDDRTLVNSTTVDP